jgi:hypothetical protein
VHNLQSYLPDLTQAPGRSGIWCRAHLKDLVHALHVEFPHPMWRKAEGAAVDAQADLLRQLPLLDRTSLQSNLSVVTQKLYLTENNYLSFVVCAPERSGA